MHIEVRGMSQHQGCVPCTVLPMHAQVEEKKQWNFKELDKEIVHDNEPCVSLGAADFFIS
jgi:hypothetical protein